MGNSEILIPITLFMMIGVIVWVSVTTRHKERMTLIEKGLNPSEYEGLKAFKAQGLFSNPMASLKWGMVMVSLGLGLLVGFIISYAMIEEDKGFIIFSCLFIFGGAGLILYYLVAAGKAKSEKV
jgi:hypothetical protein